MEEANVEVVSQHGILKPATHGSVLSAVNVGSCVAGLSLMTKNGTPADASAFGAGNTDDIEETTRTEKYLARS